MVLGLSSMSYLTVGANMAGTLYVLEGHELRRRIITTPLRNHEQGEKGKIKIFSSTAVGRMRRYLRSCDSSYTVMLTLTYPAAYPENGCDVKRDLDAFVKRLRRYLHKAARPDWSFFWFLEFQERGAPHFHAFTTHEIDKAWVARAWYEVVGSGDQRHLAAGTRIEGLRAGRAGAAAYAAKYAAKAEQKADRKSVV